jgi:hypothetical protein
MGIVSTIFVYSLGKSRGRRKERKNLSRLDGQRVIPEKTEKQERPLREPKIRKTENLDKYSGGGSYPSVDERL